MMGSSVKLILLWTLFSNTMDQSTNGGATVTAQPLPPLTASNRAEVPIVIIGAGAAGLSAADRLYSAGFFNVTILEAQGRTGGRIFTQRLAGSNDFVELGAQYIHGEGHALFQFAKAHNFIAPQNKKYSEEYFLDNGKTIKTKQEAIVEESLDFLESVTNDIDRRRGLSNLEVQQRSVGDVLEERFMKFLSTRNNTENDILRRAAYDYFVRDQLVDNACRSLKDLSIRSFTDYELQGQENNLLNVPFSQILDQMTAAFPRSRVLLNNPVTKITMSNTPAPNPNPISVRSLTGQTFPAQHVIFTASLGVLKVSTDIFDPPLSNTQRRAIDLAGFGAISKPILQFPPAFWQTSKVDGVDEMDFLWTDSKVAGESGSQSLTTVTPWTRFIVDFEKYSTAKNTLNAWLAGDGAYQSDLLSDAQILQDSWRVLSQFIGTSDIPQPLRLLRERWSLNPYFRGTYSFYSAASSRAGLGVKELSAPAWPYQSKSSSKTVNGLLFAGEATHPEYFSTVHGAVLSGWREADRIISYYTA